VGQQLFCIAISNTLPSHGKQHRWGGNLLYYFYVWHIWWDL